MDVEAFCRLAMADYERQWSEARGHQERHPLREKMRALAGLTERATNAERFRALLEEGCRSDDAILALLCVELLPRWNAACAEASEGRPASV